MPSGKTCKIARVLMGLDVHTLYQQQNLADFAGDFLLFAFLLLLHPVTLDLP